MQLVALVAVTVLAFLGTRVVAQRLDAQRRNDAEHWFALGQKALSAGRAGEAIDAFRRADLKRPGQKTYVLRLADALQRGGQTGAAQRSVLALRETAPEDPDLNLALARLADAAGEEPVARRFYRNAIYAPWSDSGARVSVRLEFVRFLLHHGNAALASAELVAMRDELPETLSSYVETGMLFAAAHNPAGALDQYTRALDLDPENAVARVGAGRAAFQIKDYTVARRYLRDAENADDRRLFEIADTVLSSDPLGARVRTRERLRRMQRILATVSARVASCAAMPERGALEPDLQKALSSLAGRSSPRDVPLEDMVALAARAVRSLANHCGATTPLEDAIAAIRDLHQLDEQ